MRTLGIDPGYGRAGVAVVERTREKERLLYSSCIETDARDSIPLRLRHIGEEIERLIKAWSPDILAIEKLYFSKNQKTALGVSEARGVILYCAGKFDVPVLEFTPLQVKATVTGYGRADKRQMARMVATLLALPQPPRSDDECDAIGLSLTALAESRRLYPQKTNKGIEK